MAIGLHNGPHVLKQLHLSEIRGNPRCSVGVPRVERDPGRETGMTEKLGSRAHGIESGR